MTMRLLAHLGCYLLALQSLAMKGATLLDYTPPLGSQPASSPGVPVTSASSFMVSAFDVQVSSVVFRLAGGSSPSAANTTAYIFTDSAGKPGPILASSDRNFAVNELGTTFSFYTYEFSAPLTLSADHAYWVGFGIEPIGIYPYIAYSQSLDYFTPNGITPSLSWATSTPLSYPPSGAWTINAPTDTLVYKMEGFVVPEPSGVGILAVGSMLPLALRRARSYFPSF